MAQAPPPQRVTGFKSFLPLANNFIVEIVVRLVKIHKHLLEASLMGKIMLSGMLFRFLILSGKAFGVFNAAIDSPLLKF